MRIALGIPHGQALPVVNGFVGASWLVCPATGPRVARRSSWHTKVRILGPLQRFTWMPQPRR